ncbi:pyridoxamine 5'-phosphate oxidase-related FMN-binding [Methylobacterium nodulans ORS 2060]|uniref:Pyridoxamine 5'-phosphate oxidase-related FMN-binding n=1 Tax=Methylobacterium nodulans (strain LMG 21967 / CNCM I-2342 / ORS 2060) TaxID=460265 RepID=B8IEZ3_METNO|nr:pyridoxamine 5'-phosphate oxidase family protein [Methylobacterium nodulans]ACL55704.1 pyridoxamine 5'-phosphate oxidase-related FMN-binding [Methylobacterium nodulans ORS 2060]
MFGARDREPDRPRGVVDLRAGGAYRLEGIDPNGAAYAICGEYLEVVPDRRLVMSWSYRGAAALGGPPSRVRIELRPLGPDTTEMSLTHAQIDAPETADLYGTVWSICLDRLRWSTDPAVEEGEVFSALGAISTLYGEPHRALQDAFETRDLANRLRSLSVTCAMSPTQQRFIAERDMVFLTTIDHCGYPTCSYKGGAPGFVRVLDAQTLALPSYNGNGMYLTAGNLSANPKVGLLFVDFERPHRLRIHGTARLVRSGAELGAHPGAEFLIRIAIAEIFVNCPRYIHRYRRIGTSRFVPGEDRAGEVPAWKRIDAFRDAVPPRDRAALAASGAPPLTIDAYRRLLDAGET